MRNTHIGLDDRAVAAIPASRPPRLSSGKPAMWFTAEPFSEELALATDYDPLFEALGANDFGPS